MNRNRFIVLALLVAVSAGFILHAADTAPKPSGPVFSMREFELKEGVNADDFDAFVRRELADAVSKDAVGMKLRVLKGDRGERKGRYLLVWEFASVADRDHYFPREGGGSSAAFQQEWDHMKSVMGKFSGYVNEHFAYTDYVQVSN